MSRSLNLILNLTLSLMWVLSPMLSSISSFVLYSQLVFAIDPINPLFLCDRFVNVNEIESCKKKVERLHPDWYIASLCQNQFEDNNFYKCLDLSAQSSEPISPPLLEKCELKSLLDEERLSCISRIIVGEKSSIKSVNQRDVATKTATHQTATHQTAPKAGAKPAIHQAAPKGHKK